MGLARFLHMAAACAALLCAGVAPQQASAQVRTLVVAASGTPEGFDGDALRPHTQETVVQVYDPLVVYARMKDAQGREVLDSSRVVPNSCMCRCATMAYCAMRVEPTACS